MKTTVLIDTLRFPKSPRWHAGLLWLADFATRRVMHVDQQGVAQTVLELPDVPISLGWTPGEQLLVVSARDRRLYRLEGQNLIQAADLSGLVTHPSNDMVVDRQGGVYIGNMGFDFGSPQAVPEPAPILLVTPDGQGRVVADGLAFPNGMVITPDGKTLIVAESYAARLTAFTIDPDSSLSHHRFWAQFDELGAFAPNPDRIAPDGICLDAEGAIWAASPGTREVLRVREGAQVTHRIPMDTIPLACMLGGLDRRTLFITSTESLDFRDRNARGLIETIQVDVPGAGLP